MGTQLGSTSGPASAEAAGRLRSAERRAAVRLAPDGRGLCLLSGHGIRCGGRGATVGRASQGCAAIASAKGNPSSHRVGLTLASAVAEHAGAAAVRLARIGCAGTAAARIATAEAPQ
jgi:hypothetical protein